MALKEKNINNKVAVIVGPTSSGKSDLAVCLAKKFNGEVVSADSRQVYKGMNIGTGKITKKEMRGMPHHLLDVVSPKTRFTVTQYVKKAEKAIEKIHKAGKLPIICGGAGFYIQALIDGISIPEVKPDWTLRKKLEKQTAKELFQQLKKLDSERAKNIDRHNKRRLIRAIEIVLKTGKAVPPMEKRAKYNVLMLGIKIDQARLNEKIENRLLKRLNQGMIEEVKRLSQSGLSWKRLEEFGLEYRHIARYLQNKMTYEEMAEKLQKEIERYAKRQMTWFKKDKRIVWIDNKKTAETLVKKFLNK